MGVWGHVHKTFNCSFENLKIFVARFFFSSASRIASTFFGSKFKSVEASQSIVVDMDESVTSDIANTA